MLPFLDSIVKRDYADGACHTLTRQQFAETLLDAPAGDRRFVRRNVGFTLQFMEAAKTRDYQFQVGTISSLELYRIRCGAT
jgi:hypothetical protein